MVKIPEGATHVEFKDGNYVFEFPNESFVLLDHICEGLSQDEQDYLRELDDEFIEHYEQSLR